MFHEYTCFTRKLISEYEGFPKVIIIISLFYLCILSLLTSEKKKKNWVKKQQVGQWHVL